MAIKRIQVGQVWKQDASGETFLVTKIYTEALTSIALLRKTGAETEHVLRVRIVRSEGGQTLPGYTPTQAFDEL